MLHLYSLRHCLHPAQFAGQVASVRVADIATSAMRCKCCKERGERSEKKSNHATKQSPDHFTIA